MNQQKAITRSHIKQHINKVKTAELESVKRDYIQKTVGILSLAKLLEIISTEEYNNYFEELFQ